MRGRSAGRWAALAAVAALGLAACGTRLGADTAPPAAAAIPQVSAALRPAPAHPAALHDRRAAAGSAQARFEQLFPAQAAAVQDPAVAATTRWAVLVGVNEHTGRTRDNVGSAQDAVDLAAHLRARGWRDDHLVVLTDGTATRELLLEAMAWLGRKTDATSVAIFHYSGHTKQWRGSDVDGDGEVLDEGLWPSDNRHVTDREMVDRLAHVRAGQLWVNIAACEAAGFADPGLAGPGRLLTFSSTEAEKSYEDPPAGNSVWGRFLLQGLEGADADADRDGDVTVEEAAAYAAPLATQRSQIGASGPQHPVVVDDLAGELSLGIPRD